MKGKKELWVSTPRVFSNHARDVSWRSVLAARRQRLRLTQRKNRRLRKRASHA